MKSLIFAIVVFPLFPVLGFGGEREETHLKETMIPLTRELLLRIDQTNDLPSTTNEVGSYKIEWFDDGWLANLQLTNDWNFRFMAGTRETNVSILHAPGAIEAAVFNQTLIPLAGEFLRQIGLTNNLPRTTNQMQKYSVSYLNYRPGYLVDLTLTNGCNLGFNSGTNGTEVWAFQRPIRTYYGFGDDTPKAKIDAVKALLLQNKLNEEKAVALAKKYFKLLGHREEDFHSLDFYPGEIVQDDWSGGEDGRGGWLPYYRITWYRKDVTAKELDDNDSAAKLKTIIIEVSGIDSSLISYSKGLFPIGSDF